MLEWVKYSAYGVPFGLPGGDADSDGDCDAVDAAQIQAWVTNAVYDVRADINLDGQVVLSDKTAAMNMPYSSSTGGYDVQSALGQNYRSHEGAVRSKSDHNTLARMRHRSVRLGRWLAPDSPRYIDGVSSYEYVKGRPVVLRDPSGLVSLAHPISHPPGWPPLFGGCRAELPGAPGSHQPNSGSPGYNPEYCILSSFDLPAGPGGVINSTSALVCGSACTFSGSNIRFDIARRRPDGSCRAGPGNPDRPEDEKYWHGATTAEVGRGNLPPVNWNASSPSFSGMVSSEGDAVSFAATVQCCTSQLHTLTATSHDGGGSVSISLVTTCHCCGQ